MKNLLYEAVTIGGLKGLRRFWQLNNSAIAELPEAERNELIELKDYLKADLSRVAEVSEYELWLRAKWTTHRRRFSKLFSDYDIHKLRKLCKIALKHLEYLKLNP